jgi:hypothetical protein
VRRLTWLAAPLLLAALGLAPAPAPAGVCPAIPNVCVDTESGQLNVFKRGQNAAKLKWRAAALDIAIEEIADPTVDAAYGFCIYAGTAEALVTDIEVPPGSRWRGNRNGYWYKDTTGSVGGVKGIRILPGSLENAQISVNLRGDALVDAIGFPLADDRFPLLIQLHNLGEGVCWETALEKTTFVKNGLNRKGTLRTTAILRPERCRADQGCAVERPLIGAALCRDRVAAGGGMAKRMKIKMGDITRCRQREAVGKTDGACDPGLCPYSDPACALLDSNLRSGVMRSIGHYQTKLNLACTDISVTAVQEAIPGWGTPCTHARSIDALMECLEMQAWGEYGNLLGDAVFGTQGLLDESLLRCRKELAKQTQKYSSKFNTLLYACKRSPIVRGRPCAEDPLITGQTIFDNYVSKLRNSCTDALVAQLPFGAPCTGADTVSEITDCLGTLARDLAFRGVALSYP